MDGFYLYLNEFIFFQGINQILNHWRCLIIYFTILCLVTMVKNSKHEKIIRYLAQFCVVILISYGLHVPSSFWMVLVCECFLDNPFSGNSIWRSFFCQITALVFLVCVDIVYTVCFVSQILLHSSPRTTEI